MHLTVLGPMKKWNVSHNMSFNGTVHGKKVDNQACVFQKKLRLYASRKKLKNKSSTPYMRERIDLSTITKFCY